jgi:hypothetical protein
MSALAPLQAHKTLKTGLPKPLYQTLTLSGGYPRSTRSAAIGQIRQDNRFTSQSTFKYRAMKYFNSVPVNVTRQMTLVSIYSYSYILLYYF